ncbi:MAG: acetyl-coenzyme A synthetase N-terminal domain-containing protein, partial [Acidobacteriota bacterium]|nr:acetyl-coenzyme A synthetase N-terminal domain-containing protein [Acidobacteriota bacterium]
MNLTSPTVQRWIEEGLADPEGFWERAAQQVPWFRTWDRVF